MPQTHKHFFFSPQQRASSVWLWPPMGAWSLQSCQLRSPLLASPSPPPPSSTRSPPPPCRPRPLPPSCPTRTPSWPAAWHPRWHTPSRTSQRTWPGTTTEGTPVTRMLFTGEHDLMIIKKKSCNYFSQYRQAPWTLWLSLICSTAQVS